MAYGKIKRTIKELVHGEKTYLSKRQKEDLKLRGLTKKALANRVKAKAKVKPEVKPKPKTEKKKEEFKTARTKSVSSALSKAGLTKQAIARLRKK